MLELKESALCVLDEEHRTRIDEYGSYVKDIILFPCPNHNNYDELKNIPKYSKKRIIYKCAWCDFKTKKTIYSVSKDSRCPTCSFPIKWRDNFKTGPNSVTEYVYRKFEGLGVTDYYNKIKTNVCITGNIKKLKFDMIIEHDGKKLAIEFDTKERIKRIQRDNLISKMKTRYVRENEWSFIRVKTEYDYDYEETDYLNNLTDSIDRFFEGTERFESFLNYNRDDTIVLLVC